MYSFKSLVFKLFSVLNLVSIFGNADTWLENLMVENNIFPPCCCFQCDCSPFSIDAEYLYWQIKESPCTVPLVFTGPYDPNIKPTLKSSGAHIALRNDRAQNLWHSGLKLALGYDFGGTCLWDMEISYIFLGRNSCTRSVRSNDFRDAKVATPVFSNNTYLAIPFFDVVAGLSNSVYLAKPNVFSGKATLTSGRWMQGVEWNFTARLPIPDCGSSFLLRGLLGFRYWNFNDELKFTTQSPNLTRPDIFKTWDQFRTINSFYGAQMGFLAKYEYRSLSCTIKARVALGAIDQRLCINGRLLTNDFDGFGDVRSFQGGYFALPTNIGYCDRWKFASLPEVNVLFRYQFNQCFAFNIGYNFLYVNQTLWAENQINSNINATQALSITRDPFIGLAGMPRPKAVLKSKVFWAQGVNVGFDLHF